MNFLITKNYGYCEYLRIVGLLTSFLGTIFNMPGKIPFSWDVFFSTCFELACVGLLASNLPHFFGIFPKNLSKTAKNLDDNMTKLIIM